MKVKTFEEAIKIVNNLKTKPDDNELLQLYGLYKQTLFGDNTNERPGIFNFKECSKHDAWMEVRGMEQDKARLEYIILVNCLIDKYGLN